MTLAEKYGIQSNTKVEEINLNQNPYEFKGTFKELYDLVAAGRVKALKKYDQVVGISVSGYETTEADNLAGEAFMRAYGPITAMMYFNLATQLVEANLIPTVISEDPLRVTILNGLVTLNEYGEEVTNTKTECEDEGDVYEVPGNLINTEQNIRNYIRKTEGYCLAKGCQITIKYNADKDVYEVRGVQYGRKLSSDERAFIKYATK